MPFSGKVEDVRLFLTLHAEWRVIESSGGPVCLRRRDERSQGHGAHGTVKQMSEEKMQEGLIRCKSLGLAALYLLPFWYTTKRDSDTKRHTQRMKRRAGHEA